MTTNPAAPTKDHKLRIGVTPWRDDWGGDAPSIASQAKLAEELGLHSFWLPESHFTGRSANPAPFLRLAVVAAQTERLRIGTTSLLLPVRHPLHVAEEVAVLDRLSAGRVILGVGRGFRPTLFAAFDVPAEEKRDRFEAALQIIRSAWRGEPVAFEENGSAGKEPEPIRLSPLPVQKPHPPIWVAAFGPRGIEQAGRLGLPYLASPIESLKTLEENYVRHRAALPPGTSEEELPVPVMRTLFLSRDPEQVGAARDALAEQAARLSRASVSSLRQAATAAVDDWALLGDPPAVAEGIHRYRETLGLTHLIARTHVPGVDPEALEGSLRLLAELDLG